MSIRREDDRIVIALPARAVKGVAIGVVALAVVVGLVLGAQTLRGAREAPVADSVAWATAARFDVGVAGRPSRGPADAPVTVVEFTDYLCPFCRRYANQTLPAVLATYGDRVRYVVRNFPVQPVNPMALPAAVAVECAYGQRRFWEYRDAVFRDELPLDAARLLALAASGGLDSAAFDACVGAGATRVVVERDLLDAWSYGVSGTPTFFINGRRFRGLRSREQLERYIELALRER